MNKELLVIKTSAVLTSQQRDVCRQVFEPLAEKLGVMCTLLDGGLDAEVHRDNDPLLTQILEEQRKTNQLLLMLVEALGEESEQDEEPSTYMDGSRVI